MLISLLIVIVFAWYIMNDEERRRVVGVSIRTARNLAHAALQRRPELEPFHQALQARTRLAVLTPLIVLLNVTICVRMLLADGFFSTPDTLIAWGANFGPRTTNGEWWRLVSAMFVHTGLLGLIASTAGLLQVGLVLERLAGPLTFGAVYVAGGLAASLVSVSANPVGVSAGASGAVLGVYGLLLATGIYGFLIPSPLTMPLALVKRWSPGVVLFVLFHLLSSSVPLEAEFAGFVTGFVLSVILGRGVVQAKPPARRVGVAMAATAVLAVICAVPLRGLSDVKSEIQRAVAVEDQTSAVYAAAVERFKMGRINARQLADVIDHKVVPELQAVRTRLSGLAGVPTEHQAVVKGAEEYLRLRLESWRLRSEALQSANMIGLREADRRERAALDAYEKVKHATLTS